MLDKIPDIIKIGCLEYKVIITDDPIIIDNCCNYNGCIDYVEQVIKINKSLPDSLKRQVFLHELMHGIIHYFELEVNRKKEERIIDCMSKGLLMIVDDNSFEKVDYKGVEISE